MWLFVLMAACANDPDKGGTSGGPGADSGGDTGDPADSEGWCAVLEVLGSAGCTSCHSAGGGSAGLDLVTDPHAALVGQPSALYSGRTLVVAGDPDGSFLVVKMRGEQSAEEGSPMPPNGASAEQVAAVVAWIAGGATDACGDTGETGDATYHPDGWADPTVHGKAAKYQDEACVSCHGADLGGSGAALSCDTCHPSGWRTDCTFCHGGVEDATGAPPLHISGEDDGAAASFIPHTAHVQASDVKSALDCTQCHDKPTDVLSEGHLFVGDTTPGRAEADFGAGLSDAASWDGAGTCANLYCHGTGRGDDGDVVHDETVSTCHDCHPDDTSGRDAWERMSGEHEEHLREGLDCWECHGATVDASMHIVDVSVHVDGDKTVELSGGVTRSGSRCTGTCHGEEHENEGW